MFLRRVTTGRAAALIIVGVVLGALLFVRHRLSPDSIKAQVTAELRKILGTEFRLETQLDLRTGIELLDVRIFYPDGAVAVTAERVTLTIDHKELLSGDVAIRQVDVEGLFVRLRPDAEGAPGLPGIFRERDKPMAKDPRLPVVMIHPGRRGSRLELQRTGVLRDDLAVELVLDKAEAQADGPRYRATAEFHAERVKSLNVNVSFDLAEGLLDLRVGMRSVRWEREDFEMLHPKLREQLPPVEMGGQATEIDTRLSLRREPSGGIEITELTCVADVHDLHGAFGNLHTGERVGLPFGIEDGSATVSFADWRLTIPDIAGTYVSPDGYRGPAGASIDIAFMPMGNDVDFTLRGKGLRATRKDLYHILEPDIVESVVKPFEPAGVFDFVVEVSRRFGLPEKVWAKLRMSDGQFNYAGELDDLTGRRFGFHYPLSRCTGVLEVETNIPTPRGLVQVTDIVELRGFNPIARPQPGGPTHVAVSAKGRAVAYRLPDGTEPEDITVQIRVEDLPIDGKLAAAFASTSGDMPYRAFDLSGWAATVDITVEQDGFRESEPRATYVVQLEDCSMAYENFPLHLRGITGKVVSHDLPGGRRELRFEELRGEALDGGQVRGSGTVIQTAGGTAEMGLEIEAEDLVLGEDLEAALRSSPAGKTPVLDLWSTLRPHGRVHGTVKILSEDEANIDIDLGGTSGFRGYGDIECPVTELSGIVSYTGKGLNLSSVKGYVDGAPFLIDGTLKNDGALDLTATVNDLVLREPVQALMRQIAPESEGALVHVADGDASSVDIALRARRSAGAERVDLDASLTRLRVETAIRGIPVSMSGGPVLLRGDILVAKDLWFRTGNTAVRLREASVPRDMGRYGWVVLDAENLHPARHLEPFLGEGFAEQFGGNVRVDLTGFRAEFNRGDGTMILSGALDLRRKVIADEPAEILEPTGALGFSPVTLKLPQEPGEPVRFSGVVDFKGLNMNLGIDVRDLSGQLRIAEGTIGDSLAFKGAVFGGEATLFDRFAEALSLNIDYGPDYLLLGGIDGAFYEGKLRGKVEVHLAEPGGFNVQLRVKDVNLAEMLKQDLPHDSPYSGTIDGALDIRSASDGVEHMKGQGQILVREGQLFRVPGMRSIIATLNRVTPLNTNSRFRRAEVDFGVGGEMLEVRKAHLSTATNDVFCDGNVSIYGDLDLVVRPQVTRMLDLPRLINIPILSTLLNLWHKTAYEIRLEGTISSPALRLRAFPFLKRKRAKPFTQSPHAGRAGRVRPGILPR